MWAGGQDMEVNRKWRTSWTFVKYGSKANNNWFGNLWNPYVRDGCHDQQLWFRLSKETVTMNMVELQRSQSALSAHCLTTDGAAPTSTILMCLKTFLNVAPRLEWELTLNANDVFWCRKPSLRLPGALGTAASGKPRHVHSQVNRE